MLRWLRRMLCGGCCRHQWAIKESMTTFVHWEGERIDTGRLYTMECRKCGDLKSVKVSA